MATKTKQDKKKAKLREENNKLMQQIDSMKSSMEPIDICDSNSKDAGIYALNVLLKRKIKDIRDNLIPVQRKILIAMYNTGARANATNKSIPILGEVMKNYAHGDSSIYGAMVWMSHPTRYHYPLVHGEGNFGSFLNPQIYAKQRYTSAGLTDFAYDVYFKGWGVKSSDYSSDRSVDYVEGVGGGLEPEYLLSKYPLFLLTWYKDFGTGKSTCSPGFNLRDIFEVMIQLIDNPEVDVNIYPDCPTGSTIINKSEVTGIFDKMSVKIKVRGNYSLEDEYININSFPFSVDPSKILESITNLYKKDKLPEIINLGTSDVDNNINIEYKNGYDPHNIMERIYKATQLELTFNTKYNFVNDLEIINKTPRELALFWIDFRVDCIRRQKKMVLNKNIRRTMYLSAMIKMIELNMVVEYAKIISKQTKAEAREYLINNTEFNDYQIDKIMGTRLSDLSKDNYESYKEEHTSLEKENLTLKLTIASDRLIKNIIQDDLKTGIEKYGAPRRSKVVDLKSHISDTNHYLIVTANYIKKMPFDPQSFVTGRLSDHGKIICVKIVNNTDTVIFFDCGGRAYKVPVDKIPNSITTNNGISYSAMKFDMPISGCISEEEAINSDFICSVGEDGRVLKVASKEALNIKSTSGIRWSKNSIISIVPIKATDSLVVATKRHMVILDSSNFPENGKGASGIAGIKISEDPTILIGSINPKYKQIYTITDRGVLKVTDITIVPGTKRASKGFVMEFGAGNPIIVGSLTKNTLLHVYQNKIITPVLGEQCKKPMPRNHKGVKIVNESGKVFGVTIDS